MDLVQPLENASKFQTFVLYKYVDKRDYTSIFFKKLMN